jgi:hypothetical protein
VKRARGLQTLSTRRGKLRSCLGGEKMGKQKVWQPEINILGLRFINTLFRNQGLKTDF